MNKITRNITLGMAALAALTLVGLDSSAAKARGFGFHYGGRNVHVDIGNPHGYRNQVAYRRSARSYYPTQRSRGHYSWHDTSHYDYHPGSYVRHRNHYDYTPGHYDFHREGHFDYHGGGHHGGHH